MDQYLIGPIGIWTPRRFAHQQPSGRPLALIRELAALDRSNTFLLPQELINGLYYVAEKSFGQSSELLET